MSTTGEYLLFFALCVLVILSAQFARKLQRSHGMPIGEPHGGTEPSADAPETPASRRAGSRPVTPQRRAPAR